MPGVITVYPNVVSLILFLFQFFSLKVTTLVQNSTFNATLISTITHKIFETNSGFHVK